MDLVFWRQSNAAFTSSFAGGVYRHYCSVPVLVTEVISAEAAPQAVALCILDGRILLADAIVGFLISSELPPVSDKRWNNRLNTNSVQIPQNQFDIRDIDSSCKLVTLSSRIVFMLLGGSCFVVRVSHNYRSASISKVCAHCSLDHTDMRFFVD